MKLKVMVNVDQMYDGTKILTNNNE